jgi:hypothetical protein
MGIMLIVSSDRVLQAHHVRGIMTSCCFCFCFCLSVFLSCVER